MSDQGLKELCSKSSSDIILFQISLKLYHYAYYYVQNQVIILIIHRTFSLQSKTSITFYSLSILLTETVTAS